MKRLGVFARAPQAGRVKTRLSPALPAELAARLYAGLLHDTLDVAAAAGADECQLWWADGPAEFVAPAGFVARRQADGDLGARLAGALDTMLAAPGDRAVVIGSDCPALAPAHLTRAFAALERDELVLGAARDGGFWLIGLTRLPPELLAGIAWSTPGVFAGVLGRAAGAGLRATTLEVLDDLDEPADVARLVARVAAGDASACGPHARAALREMGLLG